MAEAVDRDAWIDANLRSLGGVLDPVADRLGSRLGPLGGAAGALLGLEAGAISGFLGGRVLGQYEFPPLDPAAPARLLFVDARTSATPPTRSRPIPTSCCAGSRCTRPRTRSSSPACRGCASTSPA